MKKLKDFILKYNNVLFDSIYYMLFIAAMVVKVFYFQFTTELNINNAYNYDANMRMLMSSLWIVLMIFSVLLVLFNKRRNGAIFILNGVLSFILLADTVYFRYYSLPTSISLIYQLDFINDISGSTSSLFYLRDWIYFIDLPLYFIVALIKWGLPKYTVKRRYTFVAAVIIFTVAYNKFNVIYDSFNTALYGFDRNYAAKDLSVLYYHHYDIKNFVYDEWQKRVPLSAQEAETVKSYYDNKWANETENKRYTGVAEGRNLIMVQVEAFQHFVVEREINGQEITPFLNSLINDSIYMDNIYNQVAGGNTSDAEFISNNSLYPIGSGAVYFRYAHNTYNSLPRALSSLGYNTFVSHAYRPSFWNRPNMYEAVGFDRFFSLNDYEEDEKIGWAVSDESFFRQTIQKIKDEQPFYSFNITLSSHHPYDAFINFDNLDVGKYSDKQLGHFLKGARYDDYALEKLFEMLKAEGLYDNSIIVIYGDHSALFEDQKDDLCEFLGIEYNSYTWQKLQRVPLFIHIPGSGIAERVSTTGGQIDIMPTIANLMNFDVPYALGKDLLNTKEGDGYATLRYSSVMTDEYMYLSRPEPTVYDMNTGEKLPIENYKENIDLRLSELKISDIIINKDYFNKISKSK